MCDYCSWVEQILSKVKAEVKAEEAKPLQRVDPIVVVHGGAGKIPEDERKYMLAEIKNAAVDAYKKLVEGCSSIDAVERAIGYMEGKRFFNCARGGSLDSNGEVVMDAGLMTNGLRTGCVGAVRDVEHPISLAKKVLQNTPHVLLVESGAQSFALEMGIPILPPGYLASDVTPPMSICSLDETDGEEEAAVAHYDADYNDYDNTELDGTTNKGSAENTGQISKFKTGRRKCPPECAIVRSDNETVLSDEECSGSEVSSEREPLFLEVGAVGAVAFDRKRRLTSGSSTAGPPGKLIGSISPVCTVVGCGIYVDEDGCASVSGDEKAIYKYAPARKIVRKLGEETPEVATRAVLKNFEKETGQSAVGAIALNAKGEPAVSFNCTHFPWAYCQKGYVYYGCTKNETLSEKVETLERPLDCMCEPAD